MSQDPLIVLRNIVIPMVLGALFICIVLALVAISLTPPGLNPIEGVGLRLYLLQNDEALNTPISTDPQLEAFEILPGESAQQIGVKLVTQGFIENGSLFARYVRYERLDDDLREGTFFLSRSMTIPEIARTLTDPQPTTVRMVIIEGWRMEQIAAAIDAQPLLAFTGDEFLATVSAGAALPPEFQARYGIPAGSSLEGFLFPATYEVSLLSSALDFRGQLLNAFSANITDTMINDASAQGLTLYQAVTLASIIEREAIIASERPQIASVYLNRLENPTETGGLLQADPTTQYAIGDRGDGIWWPQLSLNDLQIQHVYNTYVNPGLPPGPIANPGISSIRAAIYPAETPYYYFRAACDGSGLHTFSITYDEHLSKAC